MRAMPKYVVAEVDQIPMGSRLLVKVGNREIGVFNLNGTFYAIRNSCAHQGGPVCLGNLLGHLRSRRPGEVEFDGTKKLLECPWHGWEYDLETGQSWFDPSRTRVGHYPVEVQEGNVLEIDAETGLAKGPYVVETFPVSVDKKYVVLEVRG
jgi:nitrite reductase/ring-hydroxylating ferredoxin subunit